VHVCLVRILYSTLTVGDGGVNLVTLMNRIRESSKVGQPGEWTPSASAERPSYSAAVLVVGGGAYTC